MFQGWIAGQDNLASAEIDDTCMAVVVNSNETRVAIYNRLQRCLGNRQRVESNVALESSPASNRSIQPSNPLQLPKSIQTSYSLQEVGA
jgi:hypothetical protein